MTPLDAAAETTPIRAVSRVAPRKDQVIGLKVSAAMTAARKTFDEQVTSRFVRRRPATPRELAEAWEELRSHPELTWVPPLWRAATHTAGARQSEREHAVSALDQNLKLDITPRGDGIRVRIATGPLRDRPTPGGADPLAPSAALHPRLDVTADSFEGAVLKLRDAAREVYGRPPAAVTKLRSTGG